ncbi:MAG: hypothetical protein ACP5Q4_07395 [Candidatus Caldatribacteriaceae bacterium]
MATKQTMGEGKGQTASGGAKATLPVTVLSLHPEVISESQCFGISALEHSKDETLKETSKRVRGGEKRPAQGDGKTY